MTTPALTAHAVERFRDRWRPEASVRDARAELEAIVRAGAMMRRRTRLDDAHIFIGQTEHGEAVTMAVRDGVVITVFDPSHKYERPATPEGIESEFLEQSEDDRAAARAMLEGDVARREAEDAAAAERLRLAVQAEAQARAGVDRVRSAAQLMRWWHAGNSFRAPVIARACAALGIEVPKVREGATWEPPLAARRA